MKIHILRCVCQIKEAGMELRSKLPSKRWKAFSYGRGLVIANRLCFANIYLCHSRVPTAQFGLFLFLYDNIIFLHQMSSTLYLQPNTAPSASISPQLEQNLDPTWTFFKLYIKRLQFKQPADTNKHSMIYFCHYKP